MRWHGKRRDSTSLPPPHVIVREFAEDLCSALEQIDDVLTKLEKRVSRAE